MKPVFIFSGYELEKESLIKHEYLQITKDAKALN